MSRRIPRSMTTRVKAICDSDCSMEEPPATEKEAPPANPDALGLFCVLPVEIIEEILSLVPLRSISVLALASGEWQRFLRDWIETTQTVHRLARDIHPLENIDILGDLIRRINLSQSTELEIHLEWARHILKKVERLWSSNIILGKAQLDLLNLGVYLRTCLKSSVDERKELWDFKRKQAFRSVDRSWFRILVRKGLLNKDEIDGIKEFIYRLFNNEQLMVYAIDFITDDLDRDLKRILVIRFFSPTEGELDSASIRVLTAVLNKWWKDDENQTVYVTRTLLKEPEPLGTYRVAALLAKLDIDLAARVLEDPDKIQRVLAAMAEIDGEATVRLIEALRKEMTDVDLNAVLRYIHHVVEKEINFATKRCRRSFSADLSDGPFEMLHNLELVLSTTAKMLLEESSPDSPEPLQESSKPLQDCSEP